MYLIFIFLIWRQTLISQENMTRDIFSWELLFFTNAYKIANITTHKDFQYLFAITLKPDPPRQITWPQPDSVIHSTVKQMTSKFSHSWCWFRELERAEPRMDRWNIDEKLNVWFVAWHQRHLLHWCNEEEREQEVKTGR